jgi:hypothetical protein
MMRLLLAERSLKRRYAKMRPLVDGHGIYSVVNLDTVDVKLKLFYTNRPAIFDLGRVLN